MGAAKQNGYSFALIDLLLVPPTAIKILQHLSRETWLSGFHLLCSQRRFTRDRQLRFPGGLARTPQDDW